MPSTADCSTCKFIWSDSTCHAHPPVAVTGLMGMTNAAWMWPVVTNADWCGEFQQAVPTPPPQPSGPPTSLTAPIITGNPTQSSICMCSQGVWTPDAISFLYQWTSGGADVAGATGNYYQIAASDVGAMVACKVTAANSYGSASSISNELGPIT